MHASAREMATNPLNHSYHKQFLPANDTAQESAYQVSFAVLPFDGVAVSPGQSQDAVLPDIINASQSCQGQFAALPQEVEDLILKYLFAEDQKNLRSVSKHFEEGATKQLFREVALWTSASSAARLQAVMAHPILAGLVKEIKLYAFVMSEESSLNEEPVSRYRQSLQLRKRGRDTASHVQELQEEKRRFESFLSKLRVLRNLEGIFINFSKSYDVARAVPAMPAEKTFRHERMTKIFEALHLHGFKLRKLFIRHLMNFADEVLVASEAFKEVALSQLEELHLKVTQQPYCEVVNGQPDNRTNWLAVFYPYLLFEWIAPASAHLTSLSLYSDDLWGLIPGHSWTGLHFPRLKSLKLGNYHIGHDDQFDWVLAQTTLKELVLHNCAMFYQMCIRRDDMSAWNISTRDWVLLPDTSTPEYAHYKYHGRWADCFRKVHLRLQLTSFKLDCSNEDDEVDPELTSQLGVHLSSNRYTNFLFRDFHFEDLETVVDGDTDPNTQPLAEPVSGDFFSGLSPVPHDADPNRFGIHDYHCYTHNSDFTALTLLDEAVKERARQERARRDR
ncbi:hypothetical protein K461DRAFT_293628 [Myriangium duriaei CBS 260.36]|uniref:F-box domain-containing protein n=1 Tax=Myriangium duriaei CBS 260.36 TaxID=1168546 RepID=A0A9P4J1C5_9PEZI|nr:hypothetical protein K461DRAFT_293628 [Myriangium duriaei CBS 260.36]